jgi:hypothetical protein
VCLRSDGANSMLICDGKCCRGFHRTCLEPPITRMPLFYKAWFCAQCTEARIAAS